MTSGQNIIFEKVEGPFIEGNSYTFSSDLFIQNERAAIYIHGINNGESNVSVSVVSIPQNESFTNSSITFNCESTFQYIQITIMFVNLGTSYVDNFRLVK